jgi:hypothetical protein
MQNLEQLQVGARHVERLTEQVGRERAEQRDAAVDGLRRRRTVERQGVSDPSHRYDGRKRGNSATD